jgi:hypothetical protein
MQGKLFWVYQNDVQDMKLSKLLSKAFDRSRNNIDLTNANTRESKFYKSFFDQSTEYRKINTEIIVPIQKLCRYDNCLIKTLDDIPVICNTTLCSK